MNTDDYLQAVLAEQNLKEDSTELKGLQSERANVENLIRNKFGSVPTIRYGGSRAKGTLIKESYDLDVVCYFPCDSNLAGETLEEIYTNLRDCLAESYYVEEKTSALRLKGKAAENYRCDFHIDVVPGRFTDEAKGDCYIYQKSAEKCRLKTNLDVHLEFIRDSGVVDAIRLLKLWKTRKALRLKNFVFELLIIELLEDMKSKPLADQLTHVWKALAIGSNAIGIEDPANPTGNDLSAVVAEAWPALTAAADGTLRIIESSGWEAMFGSVSNASATSTAEKAQWAAATVRTPNKPWCDNA
jgi:Nucleotidyltransferase domain